METTKDSVQLSEEKINEIPVEEVKQGFTWVWILVGVVVLGLVGGGVWLFNQNQALLKKLNETKDVETMVTPSVTIAPKNEEAKEEPTTGWVLYENQKHEISFKYPNIWLLNTKEANETNNAVVELTKGEAKIKVMMWVDGIGGIGQDLEGVPVKVDGLNLYKYEVENSGTKMKVIGLTDQLIESLGFFKQQGKTYAIKLTYPLSMVGTNQETDLKAEFDLWLTTFKFSLTESNEEVLSLITTLTKPMIWSVPTKGKVLGVDAEEEGMIIVSNKVLSKEENKFAPLLVSDSVLITNYGWKMDLAADGPGSSLVIFKKSTNSLIVRYSGGVYEVLLK